MRSKWSCTLILLFFGLCAFVSSTYAVVLVQSTFDSDSEGWTGFGASVSWSNAEGNPIGSLHSQDADSNWAQVIAPIKFSFNWPSTGMISADVKTLYSQNYPLGFAISDGDTSYNYFFSTVVDNSWKTFAVSLNDPGWTKITGNSEWFNWNPPVGNESLAQVLQKVTVFHIRTDIHNGDDNVYLDNIKITAPVPSALILLGSALSGLGVLGRRRIK